ncbi:Uncharacterized protein APZ42_004806 [Daphnia magna]|uniref:Uncharacterized protein n=2 Tax=Daphnia magna TaxID=35525 RepID=A0A164GU28_9CRUS|nr:hypothetical protein OUZ56_026910 [Daphnia magna]KZR99357.1 Uncharacterized protein APZ42_004806 [Daphnia magna]
MKFIIFAALFAVTAAAYIKTPVSSEETASAEIASSETNQYQATYSATGYSTTPDTTSEQDNEDDANVSSDDDNNQIDRTSYGTPSIPVYKPITYPKY